MVDIARDERLRESVRIYVICPASYSFWAIIMVCDTEKPSLRPASCWRVDVVKGGAGDFFRGLTLMSPTVNEAPAHFSRNSLANASSGRRCESSASRLIPPGSMKRAVTRKYGSDLNELISFSRSTIRRTATDCTRPADKAGLIFFHNTGDTSNPTMRSSTRRACCASTRLMSISRGFSMA